MFFSGEEIDRLIAEDVPYMDLTSHLLGIDEQPGRISYYIREAAVVAGTEVVARMFDRLGIQLEQMIPSGQMVAPGTTLIVGSGSAGRLHMVWKVGQSVLDHSSAIATKTRKMVEAVQRINPGIAILTTRKNFPGTKKLAISAVLVGGAVPHRLGLSETVLIFEQHIGMLGGYAVLLEKLPALRVHCCEKKIIVETDNLRQAQELLAAGADGIQFDKLNPAELGSAVKTLRPDYPAAVLLAAGGINPQNAGEYAATGIDGIVSTSLYTAPPLDIGVKIEAG